MQTERFARVIFDVKKGKIERERQKREGWGIMEMAL